MVFKSAVVIAGGAGVRLKPLTDSIPKALVTLSSKPLLDWILEWLKEGGVERVVLGVAHFKEKIMDHCGDGSKYGLKIDYSIHTVEDGTAEAFKLAIRRHIADEDFFALNGDQIVDLDLRKFGAFHIEHKPIVTIAGGHARCPYGHLVADDSSNVLSFAEKPICRYVFLSTGIYAFNRRVLQYLPDAGDIEETLLPLLAKDSQVKIFQHEGVFLTINTHKDLEDVRSLGAPRG